MKGLKVSDREAKRLKAVPQIVELPQCEKCKEYRIVEYPAFMEKKAFTHCLNCGDTVDKD